MMADSLELRITLATADNELSGARKDINELTESMFIKHRDFLHKFVDSEFGLLDDLLRDETLFWDEHDEITKIPTSHKRNKELLDCVYKKKRYSSFINALRENQQSYIINYLIADGEYKEIFREEWPISKGELSILTQNYKALVEIIDTSEFIDYLFANGVVNKRQRESIMSKPTSYERSGALMEILRRASLRNYRATIKCLRLSNQDHVADILEKGGVAVQIDISVSGPEEDEVVMRMNNELRNYSPTETNKILDRLRDLNLIRAAESHSIALYFRCCNLFEIDRLEKLVESNQLTKIVKAVLVHLFGSTVKIGVKLKWKCLQKIHLIQNEFATYRRDFETIRTSLDESVHLYTTPKLNDLPLEMLDTVLQKSYVHQLFRRNHREVITQLASVNFCWFQRIVKRNFKISTMRHSFEFYRSQMKTALFCRINRDFLKSFIQTNRFIALLKSDDCLSDVQIAIVNRHKHRHLKREPKLFSEDVAAELLEMMRNSGERQQCSVIRGLPPIQREHLESITGKGGVVGLLKIDVKHRKTRKDRSLISKLRDLGDNEKQTSAVVNQLLGKLKENGLEIVETLTDRYLVCWVWCRSQNITKHCQQLVNKIRSIQDFAELLRVLNGGELLELNVDQETLQKIMVPLSTFEAFATRLDIKSDAKRVRGITKLRNKIYVLCFPSVIYVFEDRNHFQFNKEISIEEIQVPWDIGSNETENCLYITDPYIKPCVWKIREESQKMEYRTVEWLKTGQDFLPSTLSVSRDGQLLIVNRLSPAIRIYGPDAELLLSIELPETIKLPRHAVKTWDGNFIILHMVKTDADAHENTDLYNWVLSKFSGDGQTIVHRFMPHDNEQKLGGPEYISLYSFDRVIVADTKNHRVVLLDSDLKWNRVLIQTEEEQSEKSSDEQLWLPGRLFHDEQTKCFYLGGQSNLGAAAVNLYTFH